MFKRALTENFIFKRLLLFQFNYSHFVLLQGLFLGIVLYRLIVLRIYPSPPLFYDTNDTFMDFFNTCWWTIQKEGAYTTWGSVYPPFAHFLCYASNYFFVDRSQGITPFEQMGTMRYSFLYSLPLLLMFFLYFASICVLAIVTFKSSFNSKKTLILFISLSLSVPSIFLIERANIMMYSIIFINIAFILSSQKKSVYLTYWQSILISAAAAIKPYLLIQMLIFRKTNYVVIFILDFIFLNFISLLIWQPKSPEMLFSNMVIFKDFRAVYWLVNSCYYNFSIGVYRKLMELAPVYLYDLEVQLAIGGLLLILSLSLAIVFYNLYLFFKIYTQFYSLLSEQFFMFLSYTLCIYLIISLLSESGGYGVNFLIPSIILFIGYFPKAKFNIFEYVIIFYILFYIPFLPEELYSEIFTSSYVSELIGIPLKVLIPTFTIDPLFRPIVFQLFFTVFTTKLYSELKAAFIQNKRVQQKLNLPILN